MQRPYELVVIVSPDIQDDGMPVVMERVGKFITDRGGEVEQQDIWGRRRLAYPIRRYVEGSYFQTNFQMETDAAAELESQLRINEDVLRHLLIRRDE